MSDTGKFTVKKVTKLADLVSGKETEIPESDVTIQNNEAIVQFSYEEAEKEEGLFLIKPGSFLIEDGNFGTSLKKFKLREYELLEEVDNTSIILNEGNKFFSKLEVYKKIQREPKRAVLLCSPPGVGKTAAINEVCNKYLKEDKGTCVVVWDTSDVASSAVNKFFLRKSTFSKGVTRLILIMEDIGGGSVEEYYGTRGADSSLLNLLDGVGNPFKKIPTFIVATTNNPETSVGALIDRPGRFDKVIELSTPNEKESIALLKFIARRTLTKDEEEAARLASEKGFSIAHLQEIVVRSMLDDSSFLEVVQELSKHKERFKESFQETKKMGLGI